MVKTMLSIENFCEVCLLVFLLALRRLWSEIVEVVNCNGPGSEKTSSFDISKAIKKKVDQEEYRNGEKWR